MDGWVTIGTKLDTKEFDKQIEQVQREITQMERSYETEKGMGLKADTVQLQKLEVEIEKAKNKLISLRQQKEKTNQVPLDIANIESTASELPTISQIMTDINKKTNSLIKSATRWALAVFSVRSAMALVSRASSTLAQYNAQYAADLQYIQYALAQMLAPILQKIVSLAYTLLSYINYISQAWFGINLFANASARGMAKANSSAQQLKRTLTGFDEMNVISDTSSSGGAAGGGLPTEDLTKPLENMPWIIDLIAKNKEIVLGFLGALGVGIAALKLGKLFGDLSNVGKALKPIADFFTKNFKVIGGVIAIVAGAGLIIDGIIKYLKDPTWENFIEIMAGIALVVGGVALLFGGIPALITAIILIIGALGLAIYKHWNEIKETLSRVGDWINNNIITPVTTFFGNLWTRIKDGVSNTVQTVKDKFNTIKTFLSNIVSSIITLFKNIGTKVGDAIGSAFKSVINSVLRAIENILNSPIRSINKLIDVINAVPGINMGRLNTLSLPRLAVGGIVNLPGRGLPIGGALAGEAGAEGVIPLTDSQAMETLGQAIGRYITINANITNTMNGRVLSRQLQKIQANQEFAYNS